MVCLDIYSYIFFLVCFTWSFYMCLSLLLEYVVYVYPQILEILNYFLKYLFDTKSYPLLLFISFPLGNLKKIKSDLLVGPKHPRFILLLFCLLSLCCSVKLCWWWQSSHCLFFYFLGWNPFDLDLMKNLWFKHWVLDYIDSPCNLKSSGSLITWGACSPSVVSIDT